MKIAENLRAVGALPRTPLRSVPPGPLASGEGLLPPSEEPHSDLGLRLRFSAYSVFASQ